MSIPAVLLPIISPGYREMVLSTPERDRVFSLVMTLDTSIGAQLFIVPLIFFLMLYSAWRPRRSNFHVMFNMTGVTFLLFVLFSPAAAGWFLWALPFLVIYQLYGDKIGHALVAAFSIFSVPFLHAKTAKASAYLFSDPFILSTLNTIVVSLGLVLAFRIFQQGIRGNDFFQLSRRPLTIAIAGDSGAGKDTLAMALEGLFGSQSVTQIFGDTYHKWERGAPMWRSLTHLNPAANDLYRMTNDFLTLISGKPIVTQIYDHNTGRHSRPFAAKSNDVLILSGLHALFPATLIGSMDVRVFLDTDSLLRAHWKLQRDTEKRNQSKEQIKQMMMRRAVDADRFILPQKQNADIIFRLAPINAEHLVRDSINQHLPLKLLIELSYSLYAERFRRALVAICGAQLDSEISEDGLSVTMEVSGDIWADDIGLAARHLTPNLDEFLGLSPTWESDMLGVMQLVVITHAAEQLRNRN